MKNVYSVSKINSYIAGMFANDFLLEKVSVRGEISNLKYHTSGHIYFTIKDDKSALGGMMYANNAAKLDIRLSEGMSVVVTGAVKVYERDGNYKLYAEKIEKEGEGALYERFLRLKKELAELGMFAPEYKLPIPAHIKTLGVVTAKTGAAIQDIINIAKRRDPYVQIVLYPATVQGDLAVGSIINGIRALEAYGVDVMIVGRGGGSIEDLWAFNSREVAQAVFDCSIPVISAVGHETDVTIIDFVADLRAPTPSAAAELAVPDIFAVIERLEAYAEEIKKAMAFKLKLKRTALLMLDQRLMARSLKNSLDQKKSYLISLEDALTDSFKRLLTEKRHMLMLRAERLKGLSPLDKLSQGYAYAEHNKKTLSSIKDVTENDNISVYLKDGIIEAQVLDIKENRLSYE